MEESVDCQECGFRYDSNENAFCPRCGSTGKGPEPAPTIQAAGRQEPSRKRVQAGGIILVAVGVISIVLYASVAITADELVPDFAGDFLVDQRGGTVALTAADGGMPVVANVTLLADGIAYHNATTDGDGKAIVPLGAHAAVTMHVEAGGVNRSVQVMALEGTQTPVAVDLQEPAPSGWSGVDDIVSAMRAMLAFFIAMAALVAFGGISAIRLRHRNIAIAGAIIGVLPGFIIIAAAPTLGALLVAALPAIALVLILQGRRHFD